jgi:hypothetical protein
MTEIAVTNTTPEAATPPPAADTTTEAAKAAPTPEEAAKAAETAKAAEALKTERQELREIADAKGKELRARREADGYKTKLAELEGLRKADLERIARSEAQDALWKDPAQVLAKLEEHGLTPQQLGKAVLERGSPDEILAKARKIAGDEADLRLKKILDDRDAEAKKSKDERDRVEAFDSWQKGVIATESELPTIAAMLGAGPVMREMVKQQAFRIYALAADEERQGRTHSEAEINKSLEEFLAKEYGSLTERRSAVAQKPSAANGTSESAKSAAAAPNVTDAKANDIATLGSDLPKDFEEWSEEKRNKWFIDSVKARKR